MLTTQGKPVFETILYPNQDYYNPTKLYSYTCRVCETEIKDSSIYVVTRYEVPKDWISTEVCSEPCVVTWILQNL